MFKHYLCIVVCIEKDFAMKIKDAIHQKKPFRNEYHEVAVNLIYTLNWLNDQMSRMFRPYGLTMKQYNVLRILQGAGQPLSTSVIRERLLDKMSDTSRIVDRLYKKGLVARDTCPNDKRLVDVYLSEQGKEILEKMCELEGELDLLLSEINREEAKQLSQLLDKIRK
ncbi:MAG: MarR family transcriptional regulator [Saprospiraceae bacterium]|nr:MAG: MarR family transcriptional regulator [Saprospiraceae bacterium]